MARPMKTALIKTAPAKSAPMKTGPAAHGQGLGQPILRPGRGHGRWALPSALAITLGASLLIAPAGQVFAANAPSGAPVLAQGNPSEPGGTATRPIPPVPRGGPATRGLRTLDDMFAAVGARVPQFGGMYVAPDQTLQVALTDASPAVVEAARQAVTEIFGPERIRSGGFHPVTVRFGFAQLHDMRLRAKDLLAAGRGFPRYQRAPEPREDRPQPDGGSSRG
jgi:hypothetical protein